MAEVWKTCVLFQIYFVPGLSCLPNWLCFSGKSVDDSLDVLLLVLDFLYIKYIKSKYIKDILSGV